jgi:hypothetical protein
VLWASNSGSATQALARAAVRTSPPVKKKLDPPFTLFLPSSFPSLFSPSTVSEYSRDFHPVHSLDILFVSLIEASVSSSSYIHQYPAGDGQTPIASLASLRTVSSNITASQPL